MRGGARETIARGLAALGALVGLAALALQSVLTLEAFGAVGGTALGAAWRLLGYFTILTNALAVVALVPAALSGALRDGPGSPRLDLAAATAIAMVGLVYALLLRALWSPEGADKVADALLHEVAPLVFVAYFLIRPRPPLRLADAIVALAFPLLYVVYALARGAADGWYAYWFLDPRGLAPTQLTLSVLGLALSFFAMSLALTFASNRLNA